MAAAVGLAAAIGLAAAGAAATASADEAATAAQAGSSAADVEARLAEQDRKIRELGAALEALRAARAEGRDDADGADAAAPTPAGSGAAEAASSGAAVAGAGAGAAGAPPGPDAASTGPDASAEEADWTKKVRVGLFFIESADEAFRLQVKGRLHVDARLGNATDGADLASGGGEGDFDGETLEVRRGRVEFAGRLYERLTFDLGLEFGRTSDADFRNAYLNLFLFEELEIRLGQMLLPFSAARLTSSNYATHTEFPMLVASATVVKDREVGGLLHGRLFGRLRYFLGVYSGEGQNRAFDSDSDVDFVTRLEVLPLDGVTIGASYIYTPTNRTKQGPTILRTVGDELFPFIIYDEGNRRLGHQERFGADVRFVHGGLEVKSEVVAEYHREVATEAGAEAHLLNWSWWVEAFYVLTGEAIEVKPYVSVVTPARPFYDPDTGAFGRGALALALRYEDVLFDPATLERGFATGTDRVREIAATLHWYLWMNVRLSVNYNWSHFDQGVVDADGDRQKDDHAIVLRATLFF